MKIEDVKKRFRDYARQNDWIMLSDVDGYPIGFDGDGSPCWQEDMAVSHSPDGNLIFVSVRFDGCVCLEDEEGAEKWIQRFAAHLGVSKYEMTSEAVNDNGADYSVIVTLKLKED